VGRDAVKLYASNINQAVPSVILFISFYVHGSVYRESMSITVQQEATLYSFYSLQTALHVLGDMFTHRQKRE
jgi:hypothetical protein